MLSIIEEEKRAIFAEERSLLSSDSESERGPGGPGGPGTGAAATKAYSNLLRPSAWNSMARRTVDFLLPSFLNHQNPSSGGGSGRKKLYPTAYLDGMRGLAALFVFFCHYFYTSFFIAEGYYWFDPLVHSTEVRVGPQSPTTPPPPASSTYTSLWRLPFVRLLYSGPSMVCVFFVISGYALSSRPLQLSNHRQASKRNTEAFSRTLSSLVFRRFFRLYLPPLISTFGIALLLWYGAYEDTRAFTTDRAFIHNVIEHHPPRLGSLSEQLTHWAHQMWAFVHVWGWQTHGGSTQYDVHLWTIPVEFRCSMVLFLVIIGTARLRPNIRLLVVGILAWFVLRSDRWEMFLFLSGMTIADIDVRRGAHEAENNGRGSGGGGGASPAAAGTPALLLPLSEKIDPAARTSTLKSQSDCRKNSFWTLMSIPALYLLSSPDAGPFNVPGYSFLGDWIPEWFSEKYRFWQVMAAIMFVFCTARSRRCQRFFELPPVQYMGHISYAIYLCHGPVTHVFGFAIQRWAWGITGIEGAAYKWGAVLAALINIPLVIWAADVFWRAVDVPTVRFAKWLESKLVMD
jgi:peptidoglycan/LPS O-acetylase OafA/YrhL